MPPADREFPRNRAQLGWAGDPPGESDRTEVTRNRSGALTFPITATPSEDAHASRKRVPKRRSWRRRARDLRGRTFETGRKDFEWRRHPDSNRGITDLQSVALPLGHAASGGRELYGNSCPLPKLRAGVSANPDGSCSASVGSRPRLGQVDRRPPNPRRRGRPLHSWDSNQRSASMAAMQPVPAAVTAWR